MKKKVIVVLVGLVLGTGAFVQAHATAICNGTAGAATGKLDSATDGSKLLQQNMKLK